MIPIWYCVCVSLATAYFGFCFGRGSLLRTARPIAEAEATMEDRQGGNALTAETVMVWNGKPEDQTGLKGEVPGEKVKVPKGMVLRHIPIEGTLVSPLSGEVAQYQEEGWSGVQILSEEDRLFSPTEGRITRIAPRGNAFFIEKGDGRSVQVRVGTAEDDMLDRYFRARVVRGEIVRKGTLLLEFDMEELQKRHLDTAVYLLVERGDEGISVLENTYVKKGDKIMRGI